MTDHHVYESSSSNSRLTNSKRSIDAGATAEILLMAAKGVDHGTPTVLVDGGIENFTGPTTHFIPFRHTVTLR